jgi:hypothetical protein
VPGTIRSTVSGSPETVERFPSDHHFLCGAGQWPRLFPTFAERLESRCPTLLLVDLSCDGAVLMSIQAEATSGSRALRLLCGCLCVALLAATGCGKSPPSVSGTVTVKGQPYKGDGTVSFKIGDKEQSSNIVDSKYEIKQLKNGGDATVRVNGTVKIDKKYEDYKTSPLKVPVKDSGETVFDVKVE